VKHQGMQGIGEGKMKGTPESKVIRANVRERQIPVGAVPDRRPSASTFRAIVINP